MRILLLFALFAQIAAADTVIFGAAWTDWGIFRASGANGESYYVRTFEESEQIYTRVFSDVGENSMGLAVGTAASIGTTFRTAYVIDVSLIPFEVVSAAIGLSCNYACPIQGDLPVVVTAWDMANTSPQTLIAMQGGLPAYEDAANGTFYGWTRVRETVWESGPPRVVNFQIPLNAAAISAINSGNRYFTAGVQIDRPPFAHAPEPSAFATLLIAVPAVLGLLRRRLQQ